MKTSEIRSAYLDFFERNGHTKVSSSSLIPDNDPTLMFTNSGMVPFKDVFIGKKSLGFKRATTAQKSLRAGGKHNDLENVGYTARHHTFFEMMGNFSFGDYFKEQAISFAWEFVSKILCLPKDRLMVTVHSSDEEAASYWKKIAGFSDDRIIRIPTNDNFWSMGDTGPCGPCTEIFYDHGDKVQGGPPGSKDEDGDRFVEIWNLVFMQFETLSDGSRINLPHPSIDTGMGLERIAAVMQGVRSNYDIDLFKNIISDIKDITNQDDIKYKHHNHVIADHMRAISFMIADGIIPSNEGRGYVLRRIIRRALRHGYNMGMKDPFLYRLVKSISNSMGEHYKELIRFEKTTTEILRLEEESFMKTIDKGMKLLRDEIDGMSSDNNIFPADIAYRLYDTYGFPFDLTQDILKSENKRVDESEFERISNEKKELSKKAWVGTGDNFTDKVWYDARSYIKNDIEFLRNTKILEKQLVKCMIKDGQIVDTLKNNEEGYIIFERTPFYAESGGQVGDTGYIKCDGQNIAEVLDTQIISGIHSQRIRVFEDHCISIGDSLDLFVDWERRSSCSRNHTSTHILQKALRDVLGSHVVQKGSLVTPERLRFDFIHNGPIDHEQIVKIESIVRESIDNSFDVQTKIMSLDDAINSGAMALFGEKYPENVRVVSIGGDFSRELCGGEHVQNTSQIGEFKILSVSSIGSGIKRIEAVSGRYVRLYLESEIEKLKKTVEKQSNDIKILEKDISVLKSKLVSNDIEFKTEDIEDIKFIYGSLKDSDNKTVLSLIDKEKQNNDDRIVFITNENTKNNMVSICLYVSKGLDINGLDIMKFVNESSNLNIRFGGRSDLIQAGGIQKSNIDTLIQNIKKYIAK